MPKHSKPRAGSLQYWPRKKARKEILEKADALQTQYCIGVTGVVKKTEMTQRGFEIIPKEIRVLGIAEHPLPLDVTARHLLQ